MKSHYALLGLARTADGDAIKKAFRREIARYHPDKLAHLGADFQDLAAVRARELTAAYSVLTNAELRAAYDATLPDRENADPRPVGFPESSSRQDAWVPATTDFRRPAAPEATTGTEAAARTDRPRPSGGAIIRRAALERVRSVVERSFGSHTVRAVAGFDLVCVPDGRRSLFRRTVHPTVFVRLVTLVDRGAVTDAWGAAARAGLDRKPWLLLLVGESLAPATEVARAVFELERRHPDLAAAVSVAPVSLLDWSAQTPTAPPEAVQHLLTALKAA